MLQTRREEVSHRYARAAQRGDAGRSQRAARAHLQRPSLAWSRDIDATQRLATLVEELERPLRFLRAEPQSRLAPGRGEDDDGSQSEPPFGIGPLENEGLPYRVELWDPVGASVEQVLAVTANGSIGYAAFYTAAREFPGRVITLRHKGSIISRWDGGPAH